jgi:hypothetical protein
MGCRGRAGGGKSRKGVRIWASGPSGLHGRGGQAGDRGGGKFADPLRIGETGRLEGDTLIMPPRSQKFDSDLFCRTYRLKPEEFARMTWISLEGSEKPTAARAGRRNGRKAEVIRLLRALGSLIVPEKLGPWMRKPNRNFGGLTPIEVIEQGKTGRLWRMIYEIDSGQPD